MVGDLILFQGASERVLVLAPSLKRVQWGSSFCPSVVAGASGGLFAIVIQAHPKLFQGHSDRLAYVLLLCGEPHWQLCVPYLRLSSFCLTILGSRDLSFPWGMKLHLSCLWSRSQWHRPCSAHLVPFRWATASLFKYSLRWLSAGKCFLRLSVSMERMHGGASMLKVPQTSADSGPSWQELDEDIPCQDTPVRSISCPSVCSRRYNLVGDLFQDNRNFKRVDPALISHGASKLLLLTFVLDSSAGHKLLVLNFSSCAFKSRLAATHLDLDSF